MPCTICGKDYYNIVDMTTGKPIPVCAECYPKFDTCYTCKNGPKCDFEQDTSCREPKMKQVKQQNGFMTTIQTVQNPERIKQTCGFCNCYEDGICMKNEYLFCIKYDEMEFNV